MIQITIPAQAGGMRDMEQGMRDLCRAFGGAYVGYDIGEGYFSVAMESDDGADVRILPVSCMALEGRVWSFTLCTDEYLPADIAALA